MRETKTPSSPVLSLTVIDSRTLRDGVLQGDSKVLLAARSAEANPTHPNVVSVPTQRVPRPLFSELHSSAESLGSGIDPRVSYFRRGIVDNTISNGHDPLIFAVESLLARKLGLAEALERNLCSFKAALRARVAGVALYDNLGQPEVYEPVDMLNVVVGLKEEGTSIPLRTSSYSVLAWTSVDSFLEGVENRDPLLLSTSLDPIMLCVHGVCLQAAQASLGHLLGREPFPERDVAPPDPRHVSPDLRADDVAPTTS